MTILTKTQNKAVFETGDVPTGSDFSNLIDSYEDVGVAANLDTVIITTHLAANDPHGDRAYASSYTNSGILAASPGGSTISNTILKAWTESGAYELTNITYSGILNNAVKSATVTWPDSSSGIFTGTIINSGKLDAYTITHTLSNKTITQSAVIRNSNGYITVKPSLVVT